ILARRAWARPVLLSGMSICPWIRPDWFQSVAPWRTTYRRRSAVLIAASAAGPARYLPPRSRVPGFVPVGHPPARNRGLGGLVVVSPSGRGRRAQRGVALRRG